MIYQIRANLYFDDTGPPADIVDKILDHWGQTTIINPDTDTIEFSSYEIIENHHDQDPNDPCAQIDYKDNQPTSPG